MARRTAKPWNLTVTPTDPRRVEMTVTWNPRPSLWRSTQHAWRAARRAWRAYREPRSYPLCDEVSTT